MFGVIRNFFSRGFEDINIFLVQPFLRMSFYKKCFFIILAGVALYIPYINVFNATHDEKYTLLMCQFDVVEMIRRIAIEDGHPPFHYLFAKFWIELFGGDIHNIFALRVMSLFVFVMTALLGVFPVKRLLGEKAALLFVCLVFILPSSFYLARNMRMYSLAVFLMLGEFVYAMLFVYKKEKGDLFGFSLFSLLALYTHYYCAVLTMTVWIIVFVDLVRAKKYQDLKFFIISGVVIALLFLPWMKAFYTQYQNMKETWFPEEKHVFSAIIGAFFVYDGLVDICLKFFIALGFFSWILIMEFLADVNKKSFERVIIKRAVIVFWSLFFVAFVSSIFIRPNLVARYMVIPIGLLYISLAVAIVYFKNFRKLFFTLCALTFVIGYCENYIKVQDDGYEQMQDFLEKRVADGSLVLYNHTRAHLAIMYYLPKVDMYYAPIKNYLVLFKPEVHKEKENLKRLRKYKKIYYLRDSSSLDEDNNCINYFYSAYENIAYCLKELSFTEANNMIEKTKLFR